MLKKIVTETVPELIKISGVKDLINALIEFHFGEPIMHSKILKLARDYEVDSYKEMLYSKVDTISSENLYNPIGSEQEPLLFTSLDLLKNSISSEHYRNLFANLVASAFDKTKYPKLHPSFPFIIQQLTPLDARILLDIHKNEKSHTYGLGYFFTKDNMRISDKFNDFYLIENETNEYEDVELTNISINNLVKQGLVELTKIDQDKPLPDVRNYDHDKFDKLLTNTMHHDTDYQGGGSSGLLSEVTLTRLGKSFLETCL